MGKYKINTRTGKFDLVGQGGSVAAVDVNYNDSNTGFGTGNVQGAIEALFTKEEILRQASEGFSVNTTHSSGARKMFSFNFPHYRGDTNLRIVFYALYRVDNEVVGLCSFLISCGYKNNGGTYCDFSYFDAKGPEGLTIKDHLKVRLKKDPTVQGEIGELEVFFDFPSPNSSLKFTLGPRDESSWYDFTGINQSTSQTYNYLATPYELQTISFNIPFQKNGSQYQILDNFAVNDLKSAILNKDCIPVSTLYSQLDEVTCYQCDCYKLYATVIRVAYQSTKEGSKGHYYLDIPTGAGYATLTFEQDISSSNAENVSYSGVVPGANVKEALDNVGANLGEISPKVNSLMSRADVIVNSAENVAYGESNVSNELDKINGKIAIVNTTATYNNATLPFVIKKGQKIKEITCNYNPQGWIYFTSVSGSQIAWDGTLPFVATQDINRIKTHDSDTVKLVVEEGLTTEVDSLKTLVGTIDTYDVSAGYKRVALNRIYKKGEVITDFDGLTRFLLIEVGSSGSGGWVPGPTENNQLTKSMLPYTLPKDVWKLCSLSGGRLTIKINGEIDNLSDRVDLLEKSSSYDTIDIQIADTIYAIVGDELQLFKKSIFVTNGKTDLDLIVQCSKGKDYPRYFSFTPTSSDIGETTAIFKIKSQDGKLLKEKSVKIVVKNPNDATSLKTILHIGDSYYDSNDGTIVLEMMRRLINTTSSSWRVSNTPASYNFSNYQSLGRKGNNGNKAGWEGNGGWTWSSYLGSSSPFVVNGSLNIKNYIDTNCGGSVDYFVVGLGINSIINAEDNYNVDTIISDAVTLLEHIHSQYPNAKIILGTPILPSQNGGLAHDYSATDKYSIDTFNRKVFKLWSAYYELSKRTPYSDYIILCDYKAQFDSENNMQSEEVAVNSRRTITKADAVTEKKELRGSNGVHPQICGYWQICDAIIRVILNL